MLRLLRPDPAGAAHTKGVRVGALSYALGCGGNAAEEKISVLAGSAKRVFFARHPGGNRAATFLLAIPAEAGQPLFLLVIPAEAGIQCLCRTEAQSAGSRLPPG